MSLTQSKLKKILNDLEFIALESGEILKKFRSKRNKLHIKGKASQGVATEADLASEEYILRELKKIEQKYSFNASVLAEEEAFEIYGHSKSFGDSQKSNYCWSVDPLDGTNNFLTGLDYYCVSLSLLKKGQAVLAVVYRPETRECFSAIRGQGAFKSFRFKDQSLNTRKVRLNKKFQDRLKPGPKKLKEAVFATGFAAEKGQEFDREFRIFRNVMNSSRAVRRMGSAALDLCYVSEGIFDGFWERGLAPWDTSAASLLCEESEHKVSDYDGQRFESFGRTILVAKPSLFNQLKKIVQLKV